VSKWRIASAISGQAVHQRRGAADRGEYRQAAGVATQVTRFRRVQACDQGHLRVARTLRGFDCEPRGTLGSREGSKMISSDDCRTRAVECYQAAQSATDYDARQALLGLAVQYCELASRMDSMNSDDSWIKNSPNRKGNSQLAARRFPPIGQSKTETRLTAVSVGIGSKSAAVLLCDTARSRVVGPARKPRGATSEASLFSEPMTTRRFPPPCRKGLNQCC